MHDNDQDSPFTPEVLRNYAKGIETMREDFLFNTDGAGADLEAEQHYLLALSALDTAQRHMSMAALKQTQGIAK